MTWRSDRGRPGGGFTLLELLVVLAIIGAVLAITPVLFSRGAPTAEIRSAAREVASAVRLTRSRAIAGNREMVFRLDVDTGEYSAGDESERARLSGKIQLGLFTAESERTGQSKGGIRFFPDGTSTGGRITVANTALSYEIAVNWLTGKVEIRE